MEDDKAGSEHTLPCASPVTRLSDSKEMKPCEKCGCNTNESIKLSCVSCGGTQDPFYLCKALLHSIPTIWKCEVCRSSSRVAAKTETSPVSKQKQSDSDMPSGSESAK